MNTEFVTFFPRSFLGRAKIFLNMRFGALDVAQPALQVNEPNKIYWYLLPNIICMVNI